MAEATKRLTRLPSVDTVAGSPFSVSFDHLGIQSTTQMSRPPHSHSHSQTQNHLRQTSVTETTFATPSLRFKQSSSPNEEDHDHSPPSNASTITATTNESPSSITISLPTLLCFCALTLSIFLVALDTVLIPTALPTIARSFHIPDSLYAWTGSAYLLANAASVPFWGKLSDIFGRKPIILISNGIFLGGSIVCAISVSAVMLVGGRAVQGLGGGGVVVLVHVCVADLFAIRDRSFYLGIIGAVWAVASALGPVLGGVFAEKLDWRWCFYINLPIVSLSIVILYFTLHLHNPRTPLIAGLLSMDWAGTCTILIATVLFLVGLQIGGTISYTTPLVISFLAVGSLAYAIFPLTQWWDEKRGGSPIMPLRIFSDISNLSSLAVCACDALVFNSVAYFLPLYFQLILSVSPSTTGLYMLAVAIPLALVSFISGYIIEKTGRFLEVLQGGLAIMTLGIGLLISFTAEKDMGRIIGYLITIGIGFGPNFHAPLIALQTRIRESDIATGTSAFGFVRMVNGAIGVVIGQVVFQLLMKPHFESFVDAGISRDFAERLAGGEALAEATAVKNLERVQQSTVKTGMSEALRGTWIFYTAVSAAGLLISFGIKRKKLDRENGREKKGGRRDRNESNHDVEAVGARSGEGQPGPSEK